MKIGIMGGTFNPIHIGHLLLGEFAYEEFQLDEIWFLPNGNPPHKTMTENHSAKLSDRLKMIELAIKGNPHFKLSLHEANSTHHSYTYQTLKELHSLYPSHDFYFILGADSLFSIEEWKCFQDILSSCTILAAMREDKDIQDMLTQIEYLSNRYGAKIELLKAPLLEISSTVIRKRIERGLIVRYMVPDDVDTYMKKRQLYMENKGYDK